MIKICMITIFVYWINTVHAQVPVHIKFYHSVNEKALLADSVYEIAQAQYHIKRLRYYISNPTLLSSSTPAQTAKPEVFLIDAFEADTVFIDMPAGTYNAISFLLGTDSLQNMSGATDGALDPLNNMYWTWNTGFINVKMEGEITRAGKAIERMQYHIGGFAGTYKTMRQLTIPFGKAIIIKEGAPFRIQLLVDVSRFLKGVDVIDNLVSPLIMMPGKQAAAAADLLVTMFSLQNVNVDF